MVYVSTMAHILHLSTGLLVKSATSASHERDVVLDPQALAHHYYHMCCVQEFSEKGVSFRDMGAFQNHLDAHVNIGFYLSDPPPPGVGHPDSGTYTLAPHRHRL